MSRVENHRQSRTNSVVAVGTLVLATVLSSTPHGWAGDVYSNGRGGGRWSDPDTWHGGVVPSSQDVVVVSMRDVLVFDRNDTNVISCADLYIDPEGVLAFKKTDGDLTLTINGSIESFGVIRIEDTESSRGVKTLRLVGGYSERRQIKLRENAALLIYGRKNRAPGMHSIHLMREMLEEGEPAYAADILARDKVMIDIQDAAIVDVVLRPSFLDNSGGVANERLNIIDNLFKGLSAVYAYGCDTPVVKNNHFAAEGRWSGLAAVTVNMCQLAEIRGNFVKGPYPSGLDVANDVNSSVTDNTIIECGSGLDLSGKNTMIKSTSVSGCARGVSGNLSVCVIEQMVVQGASPAFSFTKSSLQLVSSRVEGLDEGQIALVMNESFASLLNCNINADAIELKGKPQAGKPWVETMQYAVVKVSGKVPRGTRVAMQTAKVSGGPPAKGADLNVRNSPARIKAGGYTPLPRSLQSLVVRSWRISAKGEREDAPFYDLIVSAPPAEDGGPRHVLKRELVEPDDSWFRPRPNVLEAVVEVIVP